MKAALPVGSATNRIFDDSWEVLNSCDTADEEEEEELAININIPDGRFDCENEDLASSRTVLRLFPDDGDNYKGFRINLSSSHYAFSRGRSTTIRPLSSFYTMANILKSQHQNSAIPSLLVRPLIYLQSKRAQADLLASWLAEVLVNRELLSNRSLHLFLQTELSMKLITANAKGERDDQVISTQQVKRRKWEGQRANPWENTPVIEYQHLIVPAPGLIQNSSASYFIGSKELNQPSNTQPLNQYTCLRQVYFQTSLLKECTTIVMISSILLIIGQLCIVLMS